MVFGGFFSAGKTFLGTLGTEKTADFLSRSMTGVDGSLTDILAWELLGNSLNFGVPATGVIGVLSGPPALRGR